MGGSTLELDREAKEHTQPFGEVPVGLTLLSACLRFLKSVPRVSFREGDILPHAKDIK